MELPKSLACHIMDLLARMLNGETPVRTEVLHLYTKLLQVHTPLLLSHPPSANTGGRRERVGFCLGREK